MLKFSNKFMFILIILVGIVAVIIMRNNAFEVNYNKAVFNLIDNDSVVMIDDFIQDNNLINYDLNNNLMFLQNYLNENTYTTYELDKTNNYLVYKDKNGNELLNVQNPSPALLLKSKIGNCESRSLFITAVLNRLGYSAKTNTNVGFGHSFVEIDFNGMTYFDASLDFELFEDRTELVKTIKYNGLVSKISKFYLNKQYYKYYVYDGYNYTFKNDVDKSKSFKNELINIYG